MVINDYIGVTDSIDYREVDRRLGYAHEGYHNARAVLRENMPPLPKGMLQGIRCVCWAKERGIHAGTRHEHYDEPPHTCARCLECKGYEPEIREAR